MNRFIDELTERYPALVPVAPAINDLIDAAIELYRHDGTLFIAGNGGSAADADHICGELLKGFLNQRQLSRQDVNSLRNAGAGSNDALETLQYGLRAISLLSHPALVSAFGNDVAPDLAMAQQLWALGRSGDLFLGISTGGNAANIRKAMIAARAKNIQTALLTGNRHGCCEKYADIVIAVPEKETYKIQEYHLPIYHTFCMAVEAEFFA